MNDENTNIEQSKKRLFDDESYALLSEAQHKVRAVTDVTPPMRKMINALITPKSIEEIIEVFIKKYE